MILLNESNEVGNETYDNFTESLETLNRFVDNPAFYDEDPDMYATDNYPNPKNDLPTTDMPLFDSSPTTDFVKPTEENSTRSNGETLDIGENILLAPKYNEEEDDSDVKMNVQKMYKPTLKGKIITKISPVDGRDPETLLANETIPPYSESIDYDVASDSNPYLNLPIPRKIKDADPFDRQQIVESYAYDYPPARISLHSNRSLPLHTDTTEHVLEKRITSSTNDIPDDSLSNQAILSNHYNTATSFLRDYSSTLTNNQPVNFSNQDRKSVLLPDSKNEEILNNDPISESNLITTALPPIRANITNSIDNSLVADSKSKTEVLLPSDHDKVSTNERNLAPNENPNIQISPIISVNNAEIPFNNNDSVIDSNQNYIVSPMVQDSNLDSNTKDPTLQSNLGGNIALQTNNDEAQLHVDNVEEFNSEQIPANPTTEIHQEATKLNTTTSSSLDDDVIPYTNDGETIKTNLNHGHKQLSPSIVNLGDRIVPNITSQLNLDATVQLTLSADDEPPIYNSAEAGNKLKRLNINSEIEIPLEEHKLPSTNISTAMPTLPNLITQSNRDNPLSPVKRKNETDQIAQPDSATQSKYEHGVSTISNDVEDQIDDRSVVHPSNERQLDVHKGDNDTVRASSDFPFSFIVNRTALPISVDNLDMNSKVYNQISSSIDNNDPDTVAPSSTPQSNLEQSKAPPMDDGDLGRPDQIDISNLHARANSQLHNDSVPKNSEQAANGNHPVNPSIVEDDRSRLDYPSNDNNSNNKSVMPINTQEDDKTSTTDTLPITVEIPAIVPTASSAELMNQMDDNLDVSRNTSLKTSITDQQGTKIPTALHKTESKKFSNHLNEIAMVSAIQQEEQDTLTTQSNLATRPDLVKDNPSVYSDVMSDLSSVMREIYAKNKENILPDPKVRNFVEGLYNQTHSVHTNRTSPANCLLKSLLNINDTQCGDDIAIVPIYSGPYSYIIYGAISFFILGVMFCISKVCSKSRTRRVRNVEYELPTINATLTRQ